MRTPKNLIAQDNSRHSASMQRIVFRGIVKDIITELYRIVVIKMVPEIERIGNDFIANVLKNVGNSPPSYNAFRYAMRNAIMRMTKPKAYLFMNGTGSTIARVRLIQWSVAELNRLTDQSIKRSFIKGRKMRFSTSGTFPGKGWWYYFEHGSTAMINLGTMGQRHHGSARFAFMPGLGGGGRMVTTSGRKLIRGNKAMKDRQNARDGSAIVDGERQEYFGENKKYQVKTKDLDKMTSRFKERTQQKASGKLKPHPGVVRVAMFSRALLEQEKRLDIDIRKMMREFFNKLSDNDIDIAIQKALSKRGLKGLPGGNVYEEIRSTINKTKYPSTSPVYGKRREEYLSRVKGYENLQELFRKAQMT